MNIEASFSGAAPVEREVGPIVTRPRGGIPGIAIALVAVVLAVILFVVLDGQRKRAAASRDESGVGDTAAFAAPPTLFLPPQAPPAPQVIAIPQPQSQPTSPNSNVLAIPAPPTSPVTAPPGLTPPPQYFPPAPMISPPAPVGVLEASAGSLSEPALIIDSGMIAGPVSDGGSLAQPGNASDAAKPGTSRSSSGTRPANRTTVMPSGTLIPAVLETPIDTSRPGLVRAIVSRDAHGFDGRRVLVPRGSRLIGECEGEVKSGQSRVLVHWTSVTLPDGMVIKIDSPAADAFGGSGVPGRVNSFFLARFFSSALQSALYVGQSLLSRRAGTTVVVGLPNGTVTNVAAQNLPSGPEPKITVKSGALINVFVAHDIDFSSASGDR